MGECKPGVTGAGLNNNNNFISIDSKLNKGYKPQNFYNDFTFFLFCNVKKDRHNLISSFHFLCNFCTFDMIRMKHMERKRKGLSIKRLLYIA